MNLRRSLIGKMLCIELWILEIRSVSLRTTTYTWFLCLLVSHGWNECLKSHTVCHVYVNAVATTYDVNAVVVVCIFDPLCHCHLTHIRCCQSCWKLLALPGQPMPPLQVGMLTAKQLREGEMYVDAHCMHDTSLATQSRLCRYSDALWKLCRKAMTVKSHCKQLNIIMVIGNL